MVASVVVQRKKSSGAQCPEDIHLTLEKPTRCGRCLRARRFLEHWLCQRRAAWCLHFSLSRKKAFRLVSTVQTAVSLSPPSAYSVQSWGVWEHARSPLPPLVLRTPNLRKPTLCLTSQRARVDLYAIKKLHLKEISRDPHLPFCQTPTSVGCSAGCGTRSWLWCCNTVFR